MKSIYFKEFVLSRFKWFVGQERGTKVPAREDTLPTMHPTEACSV